MAHCFVVAWADGVIAHCRKGDRPTTCGAIIFMAMKRSDLKKKQIGSVYSWPIATDDALTARRRFRGIADMDRFSSRNDL
jgi:hypothetical protein